jgi:hypothetical protein
MGTTATMCPYGESDDPYPGKCHRYVDLDQDGICDLSQSASAAGEAVTHEGLATAGAAAVTGSSKVAPEATVEAAVTAVPTAAALASTPTVIGVAVSTSRCPKGLTNDPYPGRCHHYVDDDGDGYCDLAVA